MFTAVVILVVIAGSFVAGAIYGRRAEAESIAVALRIDSYGRAEIKAALAVIYSSADAAYSTLRKYL